MDNEPTPEAPQHIRPKARREVVSAPLITMVIVIVAVIAFLGLSQGTGDLRGGKPLQSKAVMKGLEIAIKGYKTEYLHLPFIGETPPSQDNQAYDTRDANGRMLLDILLARDAKHNSREIRFFEPPPAKTGGSGYTPEGGLKDSWGKQGYKIILDYNGDGRITNPYAGMDGEPDELKTEIILYSAGANGIFETGNSTATKRLDDVRSWQ